MVVVMRQLSAVLDELLVRESFRFDLTSEDALVIGVMGWLLEQPGIGVSRVAERVGRSKQSVQRTLERLEKRSLVERYESSVRGVTSGWGLTEQGQDCWERLARAFSAQDRQLEAKGVDLRRWMAALEELVHVIHGLTRSRPQFGAQFVIPPEETEGSEWDH